MAWQSIDHSLLSPSGRVSKRARKAAMERSNRELFPRELFPNGLERAKPQQADEATALLRQAKQLRELAERGMKPRAYRKKADELETRAAALSNGGRKDG